MAHVPVWLVDYNCYAFDNTCLAFHSGNIMGHVVFKKLTFNTNGWSRTDFMLNLPNTYNVDIYLYLDKSRQSTYENLALDTVVHYHRLDGKDDFPKFDGSDMDRLMTYNVKNCVITLALWNATNIEAEVYSLCTLSGCTPVDTYRMITDTMAACAISTYSISSGSLVDWSACKLLEIFKSSVVMRSVQGLHHGVAVVDYSSMYPSIIVVCRISPDNVHVKPHSSGMSGALSWDTHSTVVYLNGMTATFNMDGNAYTLDVLDFLVKERTAMRSCQPLYSMVLKVLANSIYSAIGYVNSHLYSPACATSMTVVGRWLGLIVELVFVMCSLEVVAGDTDSCFVKAITTTVTHYNYDLNIHVAAALRVLHGIL